MTRDHRFFSAVIEDPFPVIGSVKGVLLFYASSATAPTGHPLAGTVTDSVWLRRTGKPATGLGLLKVPFPSDGRIREFRTASFGNADSDLCWGEMAAGTAKRMAWACYDTAPAPDIVVAEVFEVLQASGDPLVGTPGYVGAVKIRERTYTVAPETIAGPSVVDEPDYYASFGRMISRTSYLVDPTVDTWITVGSAIVTFNDWEGPATPSGKYDLRPLVQNQNSSGGAFEYPPPSIKQSDQVPGSTDVGCFRWVTNGSYDSTDPYSAPFTVTSYVATINETDAPDGIPLPFGSTWDTINAGTTDQTRDYDMTLTYSICGLRYVESSDKLLLALLKKWIGSTKWRYKFTGNMTTKHKNQADTTDAGSMYLLDNMAFQCYGLKIFEEDVVTYNDPNPTAIGRIGGVFPVSNDGYSLTSTKNRTVRGLFGVTTPNFDGQKHENSRLWPRVFPKVGGDFWCVVSDRERIEITPETWKQAEASAEYTVTQQVSMSDQLIAGFQISESNNGRVYFVGTGVVPG